MLGGTCLLLAFASYAVMAFEYARAVTAYEQAVAMRPDDAGLWRRLARATLKAKRSDAAADAYREAIARSPRDAKLQLNLGVALHRAGDFPGAIAAYEMALSIRPGYARAHKNLGVALEKHGDLERAEAQYRLAIQHDNKMDDARRYLDNLLERRERQSKAQEH